MQMNGFLSSGKEHQFSSSFDCIKQLYKKYGIRGFYFGMVSFQENINNYKKLPNYLKVIPVVSINFLVYEHVKKAFGLSRGAKEI